MTPSIRSLATSDVETLAVALTQAFERDDLALWIFPDPVEREAALHAMFLSRLSEALQHEEMLVDVTDDLSGAAIWQPSLAHLDDAPPPGARPEVVDAFRAVAAARPQTPHMYLHGIGARTGGQGIGSALLEAGLRRSDQAGSPTALFTGAERNVSFYRKHGYHELWRQDLPGVTLWWMWRDPGQDRHAR